MGVAIPGSTAWWPAADSEAVLPTFDRYQQQTYVIDVFNRGQAPFDYSVEAGEPWLKVTPAEGTVYMQQFLEVSVDWSQAPEGMHQAPITINGPDGQAVVVMAEAFNPAESARDAVTGFVEGGGYVSMEADHYTRAVADDPFNWVRIPNLGRTGSAMTAFPVTAEPQTPGGDTPHLAYRVYVHEAGEVEVTAYLSPSFDFRGADGLRYAVSFDDAPPQVITMHDEGSMDPDNYHPAWMGMVADNIKRVTSTHVLDAPGEHVLKFWRVDPGVVLQKLVVDTGGLQPSYLGPPESYSRAND
jgi:hypothetical protein